MTERVEPKACVNQVSPLAVEYVLVLVLVDRRDELFEVLMRGEENGRGRHLVEVADLEADDAVLDVVDDADAMATADLGRALDQLNGIEALSIEGDRTPSSNPTRLAAPHPARRADA